MLLAFPIPGVWLLKLDKTSLIKPTAVPEFTIFLWLKLNAF